MTDTPGGPAQPWPQQPVPEPGVIPLRPLGLIDIYTGAFRTIRRNLAATIGVSLAVAVISVLPIVPALVRIGDVYSRMLSLSGRNTDPDQLRAELDSLTDSLFDPFTWALLGAGSLLSLAAGVVLSAFLTAVVGKAVLGRPVTFGGVWAEIRGLLLRLLGVLLSVLIISLLPLAVLGGIGLLVHPVAAVLGALVGYPLFFWLYIQLLFAAPALILERSTIGRALHRSRELVRGSWWRIFGITLLTGMLAALAGVPLQLSVLLGHPVAVVIGAAVAIAGAAIAQPFIAAVTALLYIDQRIRREGLADTLARSAAGETPGSMY